MSLYDTGIRPIVESYIQSKRDENRDYGDYWSASSAGYCMRKQIFERLGVPKTKDDETRLQRVFESGHIFHEWYQRRTKEAGISIAQELELQDEDLMVRGHIDDLVLITDLIAPESLKPGANSFKNTELPTKQNLILYDYKTAHSRSFTYQKDRPMSHYHKMQLGTYMYLLRKFDYKTLVEGEWDSTVPYNTLSEARIMSISKDDLREMEKQLLWSPELETDVLGYWHTLNSHWEKKTLPKCTCADYEGGFMANEKYNPFFYDGEPCSLKWYEKWKLEKGN